jgi:circadian clock protein KaiC
VQVFPRLVAAEHHEEFAADKVSSGVPQVDQLLGGGLDRGTSALLMGPAGSGKSALSHQYAVTEAQHGRKVAMYTFDEGMGTLLERARSLGVELETHVKAGTIRVQQIDPAEMAPGQFVHAVRKDVEEHGVRLVIIDSLNGFLHAMPEEHFLVAQLHELLSYLRQQGVLAILVVAQHGFIGQMKGPMDVSYLADTVILTRYFEAGGRVRKAISVVKKRSGWHEDTIRELTLGPGGVRVGEPLEQFRGVMSGTPTYEGSGEELAGDLA